MATLLVFIVILMLRYKTADGEPPAPAAGKPTTVSDTHSQTNGGRVGQNGVLAPPASQPGVEGQGQSGPERRGGGVRVRLPPEQPRLLVVGLHGGGGGSRAAAARTAPTARSQTFGGRLLLSTGPTWTTCWGPSPRWSCGGGDPAAAAATAAAGGKPRTDREPLLGRTLDSSLSRLLMLPLDSKPRRSQSFDMGDATGAGAAQPGGRSRRISSIWTRRSLSVSGMLLQCEEEEVGEGGTGGSKATIDSADWVMESTV